MTNGLLVALMIILITVTLLPLSRRSHWLVRGFDFPRMQIITLQGATLLAVALWGEGQSWLWFGASLTGLAMLYQLWWVLPYIPPYRNEVKKALAPHPENTLSILSSNVLTPNRRADALLALVEQYQPDILLTLESDTWWEEQLAVLEDAFPYHVKQPQDNLYGMHLYSKLPLEEVEIRFRVEPDIPSIICYVRLPSGQRVRLYCVHPAPPSPTENATSDERDAELILVGEEVKSRDEPALVFGDMNDVAWSSSTRLFKRISGLLDPRIGRGLFSTFHAKYPLLRWPLDHLFHSDDFYLEDIRCLPSIGSDHFPIYVRLQYHPQAENDYVISTLTKEDEIVANDIKDQVNASDQRQHIDPQ